MPQCSVRGEKGEGRGERGEGRGERGEERGEHIPRAGEGGPASCTCGNPEIKSTHFHF